ncbi:MAG: phage major capsid protein [Nocardioidaceae bacterium]
MSDELSKRLRDQRHEAWEKAKTIAERAADENRNLDAEEQRQWDAHIADIDAHDARLKEITDAERRAAESEEAFASIERQKPVEGRQAPEQRNENDELRSFLRGEGPRAYEVRPQGKVDFRALTEGTATAGGDTVPTSFYSRLVQHMIENSALLQAGPTVLNTSGGEELQVPKTTAHSTASIVSEGGTISEDDPTFGQVSLNAYKYGVLLKISRELLDDSGVDIEGYLSMQAGRALGNAFGAHGVTGDGSSKPTGVLTDATNSATLTTADFTADDLIDLMYSVIAPYRASQSVHWLMSDKTVAAVRKLKDTNGQYLWQPALTVGAPNTILGLPVLSDPNMPDVAVSSTPVLFGDFSQYFVRMAGGVRFERSDDFAFDSDLVTFRALMRADGALVDLTGAVKYFTTAAA